MMDPLKHKIMDAFTRWGTEIDESPNGSTVIDIAYEFERIFSRNIITIAFGEDISDEKFEVLVPTDNTLTKLVPKVVSMREALHTTAELMLNTSMSRLENPKNWFVKKTEKFYPAN